MILDPQSGDLSKELGFEYTHPGPCIVWPDDPELLAIFAGNPYEKTLPKAEVWRLNPAESDFIDVISSFPSTQVLAMLPPELPP